MLRKQGGTKTPRVRTTAPHTSEATSRKNPATQGVDKAASARRNPPPTVPTSEVTF